MIVGIAYYLPNKGWVPQVERKWLPIKLEEGRHYVRWPSGRWLLAPHIDNLDNHEGRLKYIKLC